MDSLGYLPEYYFVHYKFPADSFCNYVYRIFGYTAALIVCPNMIT
jgi:hypothetical protein